MLTIHFPLFKLFSFYLIKTFIDNIEKKLRYNFIEMTLVVIRILRK